MNFTRIGSTNPRTNASLTMVSPRANEENVNALSIPRIRIKIWQNPYLSNNPGNNIHNDSYLSDVYDYSGPIFGRNPSVKLQTESSFIDYNGTQQRLILGECASLAFDRNGDIQTVCAGIPFQNQPAKRGIITIDRNTMNVIAYYPFTKPASPGGKIDFGGAGYFYQDNNYNIVVAMPNGHVLVLQRIKSTVGGIDGYTAIRDINVCDSVGGTIQIPNGLSELNLYGLLPDKYGNIWFTVAEGFVGYITLNNTVKYFDLNTFNGLDPGTEKINNSHAIDEGENQSSPSGVYILSTRMIYRFSTDNSGIKVVWNEPYDNVGKVKSGQVGEGSGTSPTIFNMNNRRFVTIADNSYHMKVNVYRTEENLFENETRLFKQILPFGENPLVSDENSLIVVSNNDGSADIYCENNYGNDSFESTLGSKVTEPGFVRIHLRKNNISIASINRNIRVPSVVSKICLGNNIVYTYNKNIHGWYLTGLDGNNLKKVFSSFIGKTSTANNYYSGLGISPDGNTVWAGTITGITRIRK